MFMPPRLLVTALYILGAQSLLAAAPVTAAQLEVLHYWSSGEDARALEPVRQQLRAEGHTWDDATTSYDNNVGSLRARVAAGNPPTAAQVMVGNTLQQWARKGALASVDPVARAGKWDALLPPAVSSMLKYRGEYVAAPLYLYRNNFLWINPTVLKRSGARVPLTWPQFFDTADAMKRAGYVALAHGAQPWQQLHLFESVVAGVGGVDFYRKALLSLDPLALSSADMERALLTFRRIKQYTDPNKPERDWTAASSEVVQGKAGMQIMGEWANHMFAAAEKQSGLQYACVGSPGRAPVYLFALDAFAMFKQPGADAQKTQAALASALMLPKVQQQMNLIKNTIPARLDVDTAAYDRCARVSRAAYAAAAKGNTLATTIGMSATPKGADALTRIVTQFWRDERITARMAMAQMVAAARLP